MPLHEMLSESIRTTRMRTFTGIERSIQSGDSRLSGVLRRSYRVCASVSEFSREAGMYAWVTEAFVGRINNTASHWDEGWVLITSMGPRDAE